MNHGRKKKIGMRSFGNLKITDSKHHDGSGKQRKRCTFFSFIVVLLSFLLLCSCSETARKDKISIIIIPKFEIGEITGDFPGEAQLFYEKYCQGGEEIELSHMPPTAHFYYNKETGAAILITGAGKTAAGLSLMNLLLCDRYDCSDAYIVSVGCAGGSSAFCSLGDVIVVTAACDYDLGHHVDAHEKSKSDDFIMWFPSDDSNEYEHRLLNADLSEKVYQMVKDTPLQTTEKAIRVILENFPAREESEVLPVVRKGTTLSGDNYWKGIYGHVTAVHIAEYYACPDPYMTTEMEEIAIANTAACFDMLERVVSLRVVVNMDLFLDGETPESTWGGYDNYNDKVQRDNDETLDIFEPAMHNLFDTASIVIDAVLAGELD